ncbi:hypothetical protein BOTBODRAFT_170654 [Botryobasidium botryosum FD-172 SS1]|uniref:Uncharacterized protein n=1 Tax=Botryobasidium botryosum (strain FD-172 SS1) TaxID=930990 RepID=A0A067MUZ7_BOTB1|nr:hypothetical protein BOTBODRAFT_170654 [Botryobasidium botryosum FD-172 SS1]
MPNSLQLAHAYVLRLINSNRRAAKRCIYRLIDIEWYALIPPIWDCATRAHIKNLLTSLRADLVDVLNEFIYYKETSFEEYLVGRKRLRAWKAQAKKAKAEIKYARRCQEVLMPVMMAAQAQEHDLSCVLLDAVENPPRSHRPVIVNPRLLMQ